ncbi:MAG: NAD-dependent epimerase/dehydratase family protein, partial [Sphingomonadales bacterium]|nr:NAD-dependent epimerase/dehydratase family protein [Sphingomonadales bacterium]
RDTAAAHDFGYVALRYFNVAGADPEGRAGQSTAGATNLLKMALEAATGKRDELVIFGEDYDTPDGTGVRDYIHVIDLVDAHIRALEALIAEPGRALTLNCGYGRGYSVRDVIGAVERANGAPLPQRVGPRRPGDIASMVADNAAIQAALPWKPRYDDLDTIVAHALAWERKLAERG